MRKIKAFFISNLLMIGTVYAAYQLLLTDEAKQSLKDGIASVVRGVSETMDAIEEMRGVVIEDEELPNVTMTNAEWDALGL
jgi:hypothetical protein